MLRYVFPRIPWADFRWMCGIAVVGALLAGLYGAVHDQVTYTISPEYFTRLKFPQFDDADAGLGDRAFVATIGFLGSWWVGLILAWFLARLALPGRTRRQAVVHLAVAFACVFAVACGVDLLAYVYGVWRGPAVVTPSWSPAIRQLGIADGEAFARVALIHSASYVGGVLGFLLALVWSCRSRRAWQGKPVAGNPRWDNVH